MREIETTSTLFEQNETAKTCGRGNMSARKREADSTDWIAVRKRTRSTLYLLDLGKELRIRILHYCRGEDLGSVAVVCKKLRLDCEADDLDPKRVAQLTFTPGNVFLMASKLQTAQQQGVFQKFQYLQVVLGEDDWRTPDWFVDPMRRPLPSLDATCLQVIARHTIRGCIACWIPAMMRNLVEVDYSNVRTIGVLSSLEKHCPQLKIFRWDNCGSDFHCKGYNFEVFHELKELHVNNCTFQLRGSAEMKPFFLWEQQGHCLLHRCNGNLERVSLAGATYRDVWGQPSVCQPFTQTGLIKFVRQSPRLKWFKSDLNDDNVALLQAEFPHIIFCS